MPSSFWARCSPTYARWLNERSFKPPMSVTSPTLIFLPVAPPPVVPVPAAVPPPPLELLFLPPPPPQPATTTASATTRNAAPTHGIHRFWFIRPPLLPVERPGDRTDCESDETT